MFHCVTSLLTVGAAEKFAEAFESASVLFAEGGAANRSDSNLLLGMIYPPPVLRDVLRFVKATR